jgi:hypothetical protein
VGHLAIETLRICTLAGDDAVVSYVDDLEASFQLGVRPRASGDIQHKR